MVYPQVVKRLRIVLDDDLYLALERLARETGQSKAALIRSFLRERLRVLPPLSADPIAQFVGSCDFEPVPIDDVVYR